MKREFTIKDLKRLEFAFIDAIEILKKMILQGIADEQSIFELSKEIAKKYNMSLDYSINIVEGAVEHVKKQNLK